MRFADLCTILSGGIATLPKHWDGRACITEMRDEGCANWRQMEWIGWYFQWFCEVHLPPVGMAVPGAKYGATTFDGSFNVQWDFKTHVTNSPSKQDLIVNDWAAVEEAVSDYGSMGLIVASGQAEYNDEDLAFKMWHDGLKGGTSRYEKARVARDAPSRLRKVSFDLDEISFIEITPGVLGKCRAFHQGRNSNGEDRPVKVLMTPELMKSSSVCTVRR